MVDQRTLKPSCFFRRFRSAPSRTAAMPRAYLIVHVDVSFLCIFPSIAPSLLLSLLRGTDHITWFPPASPFPPRSFRPQPIHAFPKLPMTRNFHRWEVDPFFAAAEEVQDSADRLESVYRTWMQLKFAAGGPHDHPEIEFYRRELGIALGTAKWQLEEFERASSVVVVDDQHCTGDDASGRHRQFIDALWNQINTIERSLVSASDGRDLNLLPAIVLDEGQKDELAVFLRGSRESPVHNSRKVERFPSLDQKAYEDAPLTNSESMESKTGTSDYFSSSATTSENTSNRIDFSKDNVFCPSQGGSLSQEHFIGGHNNSRPDLLEIRIEQVNQPSVDAVPKWFHATEEISKKTNEHQSSLSLLDNRDHRSINRGTRKLKRNGITHNSIWGLNFFSFFTKYRHPFTSKFSRSGLKQCKDGDDNASECIISVCGSSDASKVNGNLRGRYSNLVNACAIVGGGRGVNNPSMSQAEVSQLSTWLQHVLPSRRSLQISSGILVTLGLLELAAQGKLEAHTIHGMHFEPFMIRRMSIISGFSYRHLQENMLNGSNAAVETGKHVM